MWLLVHVCLRTLVIVTILKKSFMSLSPLPGFSGRLVSETLQGQLRSNAAYLGRCNQRLTTIAQRRTLGITDAGHVLLGRTPVPSRSTLHSTERAITQLPGVRVQNGMQQQQRKPANGSNSFSGHITGQESKFTWTNFR